MSRNAAAIAVLGAASAASAQSWEFRLGRPVLEPGAASTQVILSLDPGPGAYAVAGVNFNVHATQRRRRGAGRATSAGRACWAYPPGS